MIRARRPQEATAARPVRRVVRIAGRAKARRVAKLMDRLEEVARGIPPERLALVFNPDRRES